MTKNKHIFIRYLGIILTGLSLSVLSSCIEDYGECPEIGGEGPFQLSFTILTKNVPDSRATEAEFDQIGTSPENYLDVNDMRILVFDNNRDFIVDVTPSASVMSKNDIFTIYEVRAKFDDPYFVDKVNSGDVNIDFYILVLANYSDWGISFPPMQKGVSLESFFADACTMTVLPNTFKLLNAVSDPSWRQLFPMAGLQHFSINGNNLLTSTESDPTDLSVLTGKEINMLRSLAKIEVVDKVNIGDNEVFTDEDEEDPLRIDKVELNGYMTQGTLLPGYQQWRGSGSPETQQVTAPTVPGTASYVRPPVLNNDNSFEPAGSLSGFILNFYKDEAATAMREDKCPVFSCYIFEYSSALLEGTTQRPYMRITTLAGNVGGDVMESLLLPLRLATYTDDGNPPVNVPYLLRNHIYRFEVVAIHQDVRVNWTVCPMDQASVDITFN